MCRLVDTTFAVVLKYHYQKNIMKIKILILFTLLNFTFVKAQNSVPEAKNPGSVSGSISGKVVDKKTNEAIPYVSVTIKDGAKVLSGGITKENGTFTISNLALQELTVEIQFMGYKKQVINITLTTENKNIMLKTIALEEESTQLNEVSVVKERSSIEQKIDRKVVTVGKDVEILLSFLQLKKITDKKALL